MPASCHRVVMAVNSCTGQQPCAIDRSVSALSFKVICNSLLCLWWWSIMGHTTIVVQSMTVKRNFTRARDSVRHNAACQMPILGFITVPEAWRHISSYSGIYWRLLDCVVLKLCQKTSCELVLEQPRHSKLVMSIATPATPCTGLGQGI